jgi:glycosyltransferase involved in cell wall biosynthesis
MIHFTPPGVVGGVEQIMRQHAILFEERGIHVEVVAGRPSEVDIPVHVLPELDTASPPNVALEAELAAGVVSPRFHAMRADILRRLAPLMAEADAVVVHNAFTLHFSAPLTAALWQLAGVSRSTGAVIAWTHDLAWVNPLYIPHMHDGYPWDLMRLPAPGVQYVTVSNERKRELQSLWGTTGEPVTVVPNGVDVAGLLRLSARMRGIVDRYDLFNLDLLLLLPVRITRRKNIEKAIEAIGVLKDRGLDVRLLVTGPSAPHHPQRSRSYLEELKSRRTVLGVDREVVFLADDLGGMLADHEVAELYALSDCLLFPSESEGFGLPILEAGMVGVPVVVSDLPIFHEVGAADVSYFQVDDAPENVANAIVHAVDTPVSRLRRRVRREYRWESIVDRLITPLLETHKSSLHHVADVPA